MNKEEIEKVKSYKFLGLENDRHWTDFGKGCWMMLLIFTFLIWIWFYLIYQAVCFIGQLDGKEKVIERTKEEEKTYY